MIDLSELPDLATHAPLWLSLLTVVVHAVIDALAGYLALRLFAVTGSAADLGKGLPGSARYSSVS